MKKLICICLILCMAGSLFACGNNDTGEETSGGGQSRDYPVTVSGVTIQKAPRAVAVLSAALADVIVACNYEVLVEARSADCLQPEVALKPDVGNPVAPNVDVMLEQGVEVVLTDMPPEGEAKTRLEEEKIPVVVISPAVSRADFERLYTEVCSVLNGGKTGYEKGVETSDTIFLSLDGIGRMIPDAEVPPTACYVYNVEGEVATGDTLAGTLIEMAGGLNIAADNVDHIMDGDQISIANPAYIFCAEGVKDSIVSGSRFGDVEAVKNDRVYELPAHLMQWQGKTVIEAVSTLAKLMYPSLDGASSAAGSSETGEESSAPPEPSSTEPEPPSQPESSEAATSTPTYTTLRPGDESAEVKAMQERLKALGYLSGEPDGKYGSGTESAVSDFQRKAGIDADGVAGAKTLQRLYADDAPRA